MIEYEIPLVCLIFTLLITIIFFIKRKVEIEENNYYKNILVFTLLTNASNLIAHTLATIYAKDGISPTFALVFSIINKIGSLFIVIITINILSYVLYISFEKYRKKYKKMQILNGILYFIIGSAIMLLDFDVYKVGGGLTSGHGPSVYLTFGIAIGTLLVSFIIALFNYKKYDKRYFAIYIIIPIIILLGFFVMLRPEFNIYDLILSLLCYLMYFTIENPDAQMVEQINIAREQAEQANNAKTDFLSNMSHEIRTPLNAIVGFSHSLEKEELPNSAREDVKYILSASDNLLDIVNSILDISKIEANKLEIVNTQYDINEVLDDLVALTKARLGEKPIEFKTSFDASLPKVLYGDYVRLKQICLNLLTNSVKYTKEGFIEFKVDYIKKGDVVRLILSVEDSGIGIKKENIDKLFSKFERLDLEKNISIEGTGLGLAITKKLVELMGGSIVVQSEYGIGSKFTVAIDQRVVKADEIQIHKDVIEEVHTYEGKKILVVDDNKLNLKVAEKLLSEYKVTVQLVNSGDESIEKIKDGEIYDLILMDDMMPHKSGTQTLKELKTLPDFNMKVVALTANAITGMKEKYLSEGFDDYLAKPIEKQELTRVLNKFLK